MDEDVFNMQVRKFLKKVGISAQREIDRAVREGLESGSLSGTEKLDARVRLELPELDVALVIEDRIALE